MRKSRILVSILLPVSLLFVSCSSSNNNNAGGGGSGLKFRAFISQDVSAGSVGAGVQIIDAEKDRRGFVAPISAGATPGPMVVTPNRAQTLVFSPSDNRLTLISNTGESVSGNVTLPGFTESIVVSPDSRTAYIAVPTAMVVGQPPGTIEVLNLNSGITGQIDLPGVRHLALGNSGNRLLAFSDNSDSVAIVSFGTGNPTVTLLGGFDRPVNAFFSADDNTAYILNCGAECGGTQAGVQVLDLTLNALGTLTAACTPGASPICSGNTALVSGTTMYLAGMPFAPDGTPFTQPCTGQTTAAASCGLLTVIDLNSMAITKSGIVITDGLHNHMALGADGQLFIGARDCTEIFAVNTGDEVRGCLSVYDTKDTVTDTVKIPPANGDVTGIEPISTRHVVYLVQDGELQIYDTTTVALQDTQIDISGEVVDVKTVDF